MAMHGEEGSSASTLLAVEEEIANSVTHGLGLLLSVMGMVSLVALARSSGNTWHITGCTVYSASLVMLYLASTLYHATYAPRAKRILRVVDHAAIYLLIAGTYTPFTLVCLRSPWGWGLLSVVWSMSLCGIVLKIGYGHRLERTSLAAYLGTGWICIFATKPILEDIPAGAIGLLLGGGLAYTVGTVFYVYDQRVKYFHTLWHACVLLGSLLHFCAVINYVVPPPA